MESPYFCHSCGRPVSARVNETSNELECDACHGTFVEVVEEATRGDLEGFLQPPPAPPRAAFSWAGVSDEAMAAQAAQQAGAQAGDHARRLDELRTLLEQRMQAMMTGQEGGMAAPFVLGPSTNGPGLGAPSVTGGVFAVPLASAVGGAATAGGGARGGGPGGLARVAIGAPANTGTASSGAGERGLPPRVELFVNRGEPRHGGTAGTLLSILQPLLAGIAPTAGAATLGDYAVGDLNNIIELLMRNDPNRHGAPPAAASAVEGLEVVRHTEQTAGHECPVCKDSYSVGEEARRMPCEHVFHTACLTTWLKQHNSCPVCRYELPTDDPDYERHRASRQQQQREPQPEGIAPQEEQQ